MVTNLADLPENEFEDLASEIRRQDSLRDVLAWAATKPKDEVHPRIVAEVITQDEFTHDVIVPFRNFFLVYDST